MPLKPTVAKAAFVDGRPSTITVPKIRKRRGSNKKGKTFAGMLYGAAGTGKTYSLVGLLKNGYRLLIITTDFGDDGTSTISLALKHAGLSELEDNYVVLSLDNYEQVNQFLANPKALYPEIYDELDFDVVVWEGFSNYQQTHLSQHVSDNPVVKKGADEDETDDRLAFQTQDWGKIKVGTTRPLDHFLRMHNRKTGKIWHKLVTCHEGVQTKGSEKRPIDSKKPLLQGAGGVHIAAGFDVIFRCAVEAKLGADDEGSKRNYYYITEGTANTLAKNRGFDLEPKIEANMEKLWPWMLSELGIEDAAVDESLATEEE